MSNEWRAEKPYVRRSSVTSLTHSTAYPTTSSATQLQRKRNGHLKPTLGITHWPRILLRWRENLLLGPNYATRCNDACEDFAPFAGGAA